MNLGLLLFSEQAWFFITAIVFISLIIALLFNFFGMLMEFLQAQGCFAVVLLSVIGLPSIFILCLAAGYNVSSVIIVVLSVIGAITGYIVRDSEGNVGKFGYFLMVLSIITLIIVLFAGKFLRIF